LKGMKREDFDSFILRRTRKSSNSSENLDESRVPGKLLGRIGIFFKVIFFDFVFFFLLFFLMEKEKGKERLLKHLSKKGFK